MALTKPCKPGASGYVFRLVALPHTPQEDRFPAKAQAFCLGGHHVVNTIACEDAHADHWYSKYASTKVTSCSKLMTVAAPRPHVPLPNACAEKPANARLLPKLPGILDMAITQIVNLPSTSPSCSSSSSQYINIETRMCGELMLLLLLVTAGCNNR